MKNFFLIFGAGVVLFAGAEVIALAGAGVMKFQPCSNPTNTGNSCTIHEVRIGPCPEAAERKACRVEKGKNASIEFDYTTNFQADKLETQAYWGFLTFAEFNTDACAATTCPLQANTRQTYNMSLPISKWYFPGTYVIEWKLWNKQQKEQECCFILEIGLH